MKLMKRNKTPFYYALYEGKTDILDENGYRTGERELIYSKPCHYNACISAVQGDVESRQFGVNLDYDRIIIMEKHNYTPAIDEYTRLWIDVEPELDDAGATETPHDYIVAAVAESLNFVNIAIRKVDVL